MVEVQMGAFGAHEAPSASPKRLTEFTRIEGRLMNSFRETGSSNLRAVIRKFLVLH